MNRLQGSQKLTLALLVGSIAGSFGCGAATSSGGTQSQQQQQLVLQNTTLNFGTVVAGANSSLTDTIRNSSASTITINSASASNSSFRVASPALPLSLSPGQSASLVVNFAPQSAGTPSGMITVSSVAQQLQIAVAGTAVSAGAIGLNPATLSFGNVVLGQSQTQVVSLSNSGQSAVTVSQASASSASFTISGLTLPLVLNPGQSTNFKVLFTPQSSGSVTGSISIAGSASLSAQTSSGQSLNISASVSMSGNGVSSGQLSPNPTYVDFGDVVTGKSASQTIALTNSGSTSITISQASASGSGFSLSGISLPVVVAGGQSTSLKVSFAPASKGTVTGKISITSNAPNGSLTLPLSGVGVAAGSLTSNPTSLSYGSVQVGNSRSLTETVTNSGGTAISLTQASISGAGFSVSGLSTPTQLGAGQSLTFNVVYAPGSAGSSSGTLNITSTAVNPTLSISLSGTGAASGQLAVNPSSLSFGNVTVGSSKALTSTLTASGSSVTISAVSSNSSEFTISGLSLPATLAAGQSTNITVNFVPQSSGSASASLTVTSNASNASPTITISGTGVAATQHNVALAWQASTSSVSGYNVYRGTQSGGPYSILNSSLVPATDYTDSSVAAGQTYYYVLTAVDSEGVESVHSNQVTAVVPTP